MIPYHDKELVALEEEQRVLREKMLALDRDRYNTKEKSVNKHEYMQIINAKLKIAPHTGEKLERYIQRIQLHQDISKDTNWETHVDNGYKTWHTHVQPHCFMCEDQQFINVLIQILQVINKNNPGITF